MGCISAEVQLELTFDLEVDYTLDGDVTEWDIYKITGVSFSERVLKNGKLEYVTKNLLDAIKNEDAKNVFLRTLIKAIHGSEIEAVTDAITEGINADQEPDYDPHEED